MWHFMGPDYAFYPRVAPFKRLSKRNDDGALGRIHTIALGNQSSHETRVIYVVIGENPPIDILASIPHSEPIGFAAFRRGRDEPWTCITDKLRRMDPNVDPRCVAIHPQDPSSNTIFLGTGNDRAVYASPDGGESWGPRVPIPGRVRKIIVDPSSPTSRARLFAATDNGVYRSDDGAATWQHVLDGDARTFVAAFPQGADPHFYAGVTASGIWHSRTRPGSQSDWRNLNSSARGLPSSPDGPILVDLCKNAPDCAYAWFITTEEHGRDVTVGLYNTTQPRSDWSPVNARPEDEDGSLDPSQGLGNMVFAVAPESPGDGSHDALFFGNVQLSRSLDGGRTWRQIDMDEKYHVDLHAIEFASEGVRERPYSMYLGTDGGLAWTSGPLGDGLVEPIDSNERFGSQDQYLGDSSPLFANENRGLQGSLGYAIAGHPTGPGPAYLGCVDTGVARGEGPLGWDTIAPGDAFNIVAAHGSDGVSVWQDVLLRESGRVIAVNTDHDDRVDLFREAFLPGMPDSSHIRPWSNFALDADHTCIAGASFPGSPSASGEFAIVRVAADGTTQVISQRLSHAPLGVACHSLSRGGRMAFVRSSGHWGRQTIHVVEAAATYTPPADWVDVATVGDVASLAVDAGGNVFVLLIQSDPGDGTPLYVIPAGATRMEPQACDLPEGTLSDGAPQPFGKLVLDPLHDGMLYAIHGAEVYRVTSPDVSGSPLWTWRRVDDGLPGCWITDLWIGNIAPVGTGEDKVILRAVVRGRGVWEADVTSPDQGSDVPGIYVLRNWLDRGWLDRCPDGHPNPYNPTTAVWHYQCSGVRVEAPSLASDGRHFFQTDPEASGVHFTDLAFAPKVSHVLFDMIRDHSDAIPARQLVRVHAQVHYRGPGSASGTSVWVLYLPAYAGAPALNGQRPESNGTPRANFDFWGQFKADGTIDPDMAIDPHMPGHSWWKAVGDPVVLGDITEDAPGIASWAWSAPPLSVGGDGHYCLAVFVHSRDYPISENTSFDIDEIAMRNRQVGQRNLHLIDFANDDAGGDDAVDGSGSALVEFHKSSGQERRATLRFDLRTLPPAIRVRLQFSGLRTKESPDRAIRGARKDLENPMRWLARAVSNLLAKRRGGPTFSPAYTVTGNQVDVIDAVIAASPPVTCRMTVEQRGRLELDRRYRIDVLHLTDDEVVRGSSFDVVRSKRSLQRREFFLEESEAEEDQPRRPPWIEYISQH